MPILHVSTAEGADSFGLSREADHKAILGTFIAAILHDTEETLPKEWFTPGGWEDWCDHGTFAKDSPNRRGGDLTVSSGDGASSYALMNATGGVLMLIDTDV